MIGRAGKAGPRRFTPKYLAGRHWRQSAFCRPALRSEQWCGSPLSRSLLGAKRTWLVAAHMSASDPERTCLRI